VPERKLGMPDYKLNHLSSLLYESYYPRSMIRVNLAQTATELEARGETKLHRVAGVMNHSMRVRGETRARFYEKSDRLVKSIRDKP